MQFQINLKEFQKKRYLTLDFKKNKIWYRRTGFFSHNGNRYAIFKILIFI